MLGLMLACPAAWLGALPVTGDSSGVGVGCRCMLVKDAGVRLYLWGALGRLWRALACSMCARDSSCCCSTSDSQPTGRGTIFGVYLTAMLIMKRALQRGLCADALNNTCDCVADYMRPVFFCMLQIRAVGIEGIA